MYNQTAWDIANELEAFYAQPEPMVLDVPIVFDMSDWIALHECGTAACLAGSITAMKAPKEYLDYLRFYKGNALVEDFRRPWTVAKQILDVETDIADELFLPRRHSVRITIEDAIETLRHFAQTGVVDWEPVYRRIDARLND